MDDALQAAADALRRGGVVAHACEGVWGLACDAFDEAAATRVLDIKGRVFSMGLIVIGGCPAAFAPELEPLDDGTTARIKASWPGAVTWIVPTVRFPRWITGGRKTVAVRVPGHAQSRALAAAFGSPIVSTSANRTGEAPCLTESAVRETLGDDVDYLLPGTVGDRAGPSSIVDALTGETLR